MRKAIAVVLVAMAVVLSVTAKPAAADPSSQCNGQVVAGIAARLDFVDHHLHRGCAVAGIAATWPWAHNEKEAFPPPPGAIALWIQEFGPQVGISSVRQLQQLFCGAT